MCGFVALVSAKGPVRRDAVSQAADSIAHRGPDDSGTVTRDQICFAFRRLAILDLSPAGHQPMHSPDDRLTIVFNGEIYNFVELRDELRALGHTFQSSGDTEVLLHAYMQWGAEAIRRLRGMFALCIHDRADGSVLVARDRFGIKPLYWCETAAGVLLASELKAIRASGLWTGGVNERHFATILSYGRSDATPETPATVLEGVQQVPAAHLLRISRDGQVTSSAYWDPTRVGERSLSHDADRFREVFDEAMRLHLRADVPVGVMLSGGMDSTAITCTMAEMVREQSAADFALHAFSYQSAEFDEAEQIADTVATTGAIAHVLRDEDAATVWQGLRDAIWHHDEPVHSPTVLVGYRLYALAAAVGIRVVLNGQGADETLGGYGYFVEHALIDRAAEVSPTAFAAELEQGAAMLGTNPTVLAARLKSLRRADRWRRIPGYTRIAAGRRMRESGAALVLSPAFAERATPNISRPSTASFSDAILRSMGSAPLPQYLRVEDRNSMAHSIESRVPFLDHVLVEHALRLPTPALVSDGWNKRILREAMRGRIPASVSERRAKLGFPTAARAWFAGPLAGPLRDLLAGSAAARSGWFNVPVVRAALEAHVAGTADHTNTLFAFAQVSAWLELHAAGWQR